MNRNSKIYVAGSGGLLGSAIVRRLRLAGYENLLTPSRGELELISYSDTARFFDRARPEYVFLAAARVGGVCSNNKREADFLLHNLQIQNNVIEASYQFEVKKLLFTGSACVYPRLATNPISESALLTGPLEPSNEWYAIAKIAGIKLCQAFRKQYNCDFISVMPTNLYGPGDKYDLESSHVLPALLRKFHEAKMNNSPTVVCWGSGKPTREFLYSEDCADACIHLMDCYSDDLPVNIGNNSAISIGTLAGLIAEVIGYKGDIEWDSSRPDGTPFRKLDGSTMHALGWQPKVRLRRGLELTYNDFVAQQIGPKRIYDNAR